MGFFCIFFLLACLVNQFPVTFKEDKEHILHFCICLVLTSVHNRLWEVTFLNYITLSMENLSSLGCAYILAFQLFLKISIRNSICHLCQILPLCFVLGKSLDSLRSSLIPSQIKLCNSVCANPYRGFRKLRAWAVVYSVIRHLNSCMSDCLYSKHSSGH